MKDVTFKNFLLGKIKELRGSGNYFRYHFLDLPLSDERWVEESQPDFMYPWKLGEELGIPTDDAPIVFCGLDIKYILEYDGVVFLIRFYNEEK